MCIRSNHLLVKNLSQGAFAVHLDFASLHLGRGLSPYKFMYKKGKL